MADFEASSGSDQLRRTRLMSDIPRLLSALEQGESHAAEQLLPLAYDEPRRLAASRLSQEKPGQTLQATALVHEAYLRLVGGDPDRPWDGREHFFAAAAEAIRRILIDNARSKARRKRGGDLGRVDLADRAGPDTDEELLAFDEALNRLASLSTGRVRNGPMPPHGSATLWAVDRVSPSANCG